MRKLILFFGLLISLSSIALASVTIKDDYEGWTGINQGNWTTSTGTNNAILISDATRCYAGSQCLFIESPSDLNNPVFLETWSSNPYRWAFPTNDSQFVTMFQINNSGSAFVLYFHSGLKRLYLTVAANGSFCNDNSPPYTRYVTDGNWHKLRINFTKDTNNAVVWVDEQNPVTWENTIVLLNTGILVGGVGGLYLDNFAVCNETATDCYTNAFGPAAAPTITSYNELDAEQDNTAWNDNTSFPIPTYDTTPTVDIATDINSNCRMTSSQGVGDKNYTGMQNNARNCSGDGTKNHTCTLDPMDELKASTEYLYISCLSTTGFESKASTSGALKLSLLGIEVNSTKALDDGITSSEIGAFATIYSDKKVYLANTTNQATGIVDRLVAYGSYRWMFNLYDTSAIGLFNLTPRIYVMEIPLETLTYDQIKNQVSAYINATYP